MVDVYKIAAVGDLHCYEETVDFFRYPFGELNQKADSLFLCGDLTRRGKMQEIEILISELAEVTIPTFAVMGNHDYHEKNQLRFVATLEQAGVTVLDGNYCVLKVRNFTVGITGTKGFAGGFGLRALPDFGEELWRQIYRETMKEANKITNALKRLKTDVKILLLHYAPILTTITGEDPQIYAFLGSSELAKAADEGGANLILHSHAHYGQLKGQTPGGTPVRNVALPLIGQTYKIFHVPVPLTHLP